MSQSLDRSDNYSWTDTAVGQREDQPIKQFGALPYRSETNGRLSILLITSRETKRWIIPKGNPIGGLLPHETAEREAFEEAGVRGQIDPVPVGAFTYSKRLKDGRCRNALVTIFPLAVTRTARTWPEQNEREQRWCDASEAVALVDEESLKLLLRSFRDRPRPLA